nr:type II toxin-antitoxin system HicA family toxin [Escherichia coli]USC09632.1 type II toxin-antitoxin system HicA family toxin [Escherichia coli]
MRVYNCFQVREDIWKSADLLKELIAAGCELKRHKASSHQIWWSPITGKTFPVPHPKKDLPLGTVRSIKKWRGFNPRRL